MKGSCLTGLPVCELAFLVLKPEAELEILLLLNPNPSNFLLL